MNKQLEHIENVNNFVEIGSSEMLTYFKIMSVLDSDSSRKLKLEMLMNDDYLNGQIADNKKSMVCQAIKLIREGIKFDYHKFHYKINILDEYFRKIN